MPVYVEVDVASGLPDFALVGDLAPEVKEARERVRTSMRNSGFTLPARRVTINLAPADLRKEGTGYDLAMAVGILSAYELIRPQKLDETVLLGELGLNGTICAVSGILPMVLAAKEQGMKVCFVPEANIAEGSVVSGIAVVGVATLAEAVDLLEHPEKQEPADPPVSQDQGEYRYSVDFSEINGQHTMRRAAEVAAAGMHNLLLVGSPGSGKTMIARRIPTILPELTWEESLEVTRGYSVSGLVPSGTSLIRTRPFRTPHHTISSAALVGGGRRPHPGEVSLASRGVLFLDELPEFQKSALEALRQPLEDRRVTVSRVEGTCVFPADMMLCAAMNPCRCGYYPDRTRCHCSESEVRKYLQRISRPLLDRIDISVEAPPVGYEELGGSWDNEPSAAIRERVEAAWEIQKERFAGTGILFNAQMSSSDIARWCSLGNPEEKLMAEAFTRMDLSARGYHRILKVARTIADLDYSPEITEMHLMEALGYRGLDRRFWG